MWAGHDGIVNTVFVTDPAYRLPGGVHVGSSALEVKATLGTPAWAHEINPYNYTYCFRDGTSVELLTAQPHVFAAVSTITVCGCHPSKSQPAPGCWEP